MEFRPTFSAYLVLSTIEKMVHLSINAMLTTQFVVLFRRLLVVFLKYLSASILYLL